MPSPVDVDRADDSSPAMKSGIKSGSNSISAVDQISASVAVGAVTQTRLQGLGGMASSPPGWMMWLPWMPVPDALRDWLKRERRSDSRSPVSSTGHASGPKASSELAPAVSSPPSAPQSVRICFNWSSAKPLPMPPRSISRPGASQVTAGMSGWTVSRPRMGGMVSGFAGFPELDAAAERDVEQAAGAGVGVERG